jgi:long-chain acyl-CoA synthetase
LEEEISGRRVAKLLREHAIDVLPGTPPMYAELTRLPTAKPLKVKKSRFLSGGSRLDTEVADSFAEKYEQRLISCYHSTEVGVVSLDLAAKTPTSVGKALPGVEIRITDKDGTRLAAGKAGLIWVRGASVSPRSIGPFAETEGIARRPGMVGIGEVDGEGWYRTGDLGKLDRQGRLFLVGREDDVVKVDGKRVALGEVEGCLESFPKVKAAQARVIVDPMTGAMVVARVVTRSTCEAEELIDHCARNLAPYKVPRRIEFCEQI